MIYVLTYATHSFGNFDEMIDNDYGVQFVILGWGKKWEGYMGKLNMIYDYCKKLKENDIVIQLDGFDVWINNYLSEAIKYFKEKNYKVLFSKETTDDSRYLGLKEYLNPIEELKSESLSSKIFNSGISCKFSNIFI